jgi:hypothetical protein
VVRLFSVGVITLTVDFVMTGLNVMGMITRVLFTVVGITVIVDGREPVLLSLSTLSSESVLSLLMIPLRYVLNRLFKRFLVSLSEGTTICGTSNLGLTGGRLSVVFPELVFTSLLLVSDVEFCVFNLALVVLVRSMMAFKLGLTESGALSNASCNIVSVLAALALTDIFALLASVTERIDFCPEFESD